MTSVHSPNDLNSRLLSSFDHLFDSHHSFLLPHSSSQWHELCSDLQVPHSEASLNEDTLQIAHNVGKAMEVLCQAFLDMDVFADDVKARFAHNTTGISTRPEILECPKPTRYLPAAHDWLLANLHNPYPTLPTREKIGEAEGFSRKSIDNWFIDARKYIGWNTLRQKFKTRKQMLEGATAYFKPAQGKSRTAGVHDDAFQSLAERAKTMFDDGSESSQPSSRSVSEARSTSEDEKGQLYNSLSQVKAQSSTSLKQQSPVSIVPPALTNRKRRADDDDSDVVVQVQSKKRSRTDEDEETEPTTPTAPKYPTTAAPANRKRRLSESDGGSLPKRPRHQVIPQPGRSVSEPLLPSIPSQSLSELENWFPVTFKLEPSPELDISSAELFLPDLDDSWSNSSSSSGLSTPNSYSPDSNYSSLPNLDCSSPSSYSDVSDLETVFNTFDTDALLLSSNTTFDPLTWATTPKAASFPSQPLIIDSSANQHGYWQPSLLDGDTTGSVHADDELNSQLFSTSHKSITEKPSLSNLVLTPPSQSS